MANLPYDTDLEFVKILTRADIEKDLPDKYVKNIKRTQSVTKNHPKSIVKGEEIEMKITDLLQTLQTENNKFVNCTPRSEKNIAINEIKRVKVKQLDLIVRKNNLR